MDNVIEVRMSANFGLGLIPEMMEFALQKAGVAALVKPFEKNQLLPHVSRLAVLAGAAPQLDVFLCDLQSWLDPEGDDLFALSDAVTVFANTLEIALAAGAQIVVALAPRDDLGRADARCVMDAAVAKFRQLATHPRMHLIDLKQVAEDYEVYHIHVGHSELKSVLPFTDEFQVSVGARIAREVFRLFGPQHKVLVVDCDNTIWTGECAAGGDVVLSEANLLLQETLRQLVARGFLLTLASKNEPEDVLNCLRSTPGMLISEDDVTAFEVGWAPKSTSVSNLVKRLGLGADSFIFIDDDSFECADVNFHHPSVVVLPFTGEPTELRRHIAHLWPIDERAGEVSDEDRTRAQWYQQDRVRRSQSATCDLDEFLQIVELSVDVSPSQPDDFPRLAQLTHRATQWNTLVRGISPEFLASHIQTGTLHTLRVRDRYGDYGIVGAIGCEKHDERLAVTVLALSCRALGKNVEFSIFHHLTELAAELDCDVIEAPAHCTVRNAAMRRLFRHMGFTESQHGPNQASYRISASALRSQLEPRPYGVRALTAPQTEAEHEDPAPTTTLTRWHDLGDVALYFSRADLLLRTLLASRSHSSGHRRPILAPRTPTEAEVLRIWKSVLPLQEISVEDDFFDLQADSLRAVQILARVKRRLNVELPLDFLFEKTFSVAAISEAVDLARLLDMDPGQLAAEIKAIEAMSDDDIANQLRAAGLQP